MHGMYRRDNKAALHLTTQTTPARSMHSSAAFAASAPLGAGGAPPGVRSATARRGAGAGSQAAARRGGAARMAVIAPETAKVLVGVYGVLIAGGGVGAYLKTKSAVSAASGLVSGALLAYAFSAGNIGLALFTACALSAVFGVRFAKTGKVMPSLVLCVLSVVFATMFGLAIYG